jgi:hypothetical protein
LRLEPLLATVTLTPFAHGEVVPETVRRRLITRVDAIAAEAVWQSTTLGAVIVDVCGAVTAAAVVPVSGAITGAGAVGGTSATLLV